MIATAATGTTTATAILPPAERPLLLPGFVLVVASAEPEDLLAGGEDVLVGVLVAEGNRCGLCVNVETTVCGLPLPVDPSPPVVVAPVVTTTTEGDPVTGDAEP